MNRKILYIFLISVLMLGTFSTLAPTITSPITQQNSITATTANLFGPLLNSLTETTATPTISSTDITGPHVQGQPAVFHVTATNPTTTSYDWTLFIYTISNISLDDIVTFDIQNPGDGSWVPMLDGLEQTGTDVVGGFGQPMPAGMDATSTFRIAFKKGGSYPISIQVLDDVDKSLLASLTATIKLPALYTDDITGLYNPSKPVIFNVTATNPTDKEYSWTLFIYTISNINLSDIETFDIQNPGDGSWVSLLSGLEQSGPDVMGGFGQPMPAGMDATSTFRITFKKCGSYPVSIQLLDDADKSLLALMSTAVNIKYGIYLPLLKR